MAQLKTVPAAARAAIKAQIDENLKRAYHEALTEDVPDRFRDLLEQLRAKEHGGQSALPAGLGSGK